MTTPALIMEAAITKVASLATARDAATLFAPHKTGQPFASAAAAKKEAFEIEMRNVRFTNAYGKFQMRETTAQMVVRLGTPPFTIEKIREQWARADVLRIADALETKVWFPADTQACFFDTDFTDKNDANWWLTEIFFNITWLQVFPS